MEANKWVKLLLPITNSNPTPDPYSDSRDGETSRWWTFQLAGRYKRIYQTLTNFFLGLVPPLLFPLYYFRTHPASQKCQGAAGAQNTWERKHCHFRPRSRFQNVFIYFYCLYNIAIQLIIEVYERI